MMNKLFFLSLVVFFTITGCFFCQNYSLSEYITGYEEMERLTGWSIAYYEQYGKLPDEFSKLVESNAFKRNGGNLNQYEKYNAKLTKISDDKIELSFLFGKKKDLFLSIHELIGGQQMITYLKNGIIIKEFRRAKDGRCLELFNTQGRYSSEDYDFETGIFLINPPSSE